MSNYQIKIAEFCYISTDIVQKLVPNFYEKENYVLHHENWQLYLQLGLKLKKKIHGI